MPNGYQSALRHFAQYWPRAMSFGLEPVFMIFLPFFFFLTSRESPDKSALHYAAARVVRGSTRVTHASFLARVESARPS